MSNPPLPDGNRSTRPRHFPPPPPLVAKPQGLWRRTPPAVFLPILGLFGLGLSWRALAAQPGMGGFAPLGEAVLGATLLVFAFALIAWLSKPLRRPGVVMQELGVLPGRAGLAAMALGIMLAGATLRPFAPGLAVILVVTGILALALLGVLIGVLLLRGPAERRVVAPDFHLIYGGYILAPPTLVPLGYTQVSTVILWGSVGVAVLIWAASLHQMIARVPPAPLRPLLSLHLMPASLLAIVAAGLGMADLALGFAVMALVLLVGLLGAARWLLAAGFSPLWGALTYPLAASAAGLEAGLAAGLAGPGQWIGAIVLIAATGAVPWITYPIMKDWAKGKLAKKTNAATL